MVRRRADGNRRGEVVSDHLDPKTEARPPAVGGDDALRPKGHCRRDHECIGQSDLLLFGAQLRRTSTDVTGDGSGAVAARDADLQIVDTLRVNEASRSPPERSGPIAAAGMGRANR